MAITTEEFRDKWTRIGLDCSECDYQKTEKAIAALYKSNGLDRPSFTWCRSPIEGAICLALFNAVHECFADTKHPFEFVPQLAQEWNRRRFENPRDIHDHITSTRQLGLLNDTHLRLIDNVALAAAKLTPQGESQLNSILESLTDLDNLSKCSSTLITNSFHGQHDWSIPYYMFAEEVDGHKYSKKDRKQLGHWQEISMSCGWWSAFDHLAIAIEKPVIQRINDRNECHNTEGPAISYGDGFDIYMINDIRVNETIVMRPQDQTIAEIDSETNGDVRSIRIERYGWLKYLEDCGAVTIDERYNDVENTYEALMETPRGEKRLIVTCPTGRMHELSCPRECSTCAEAQKWRAGEAAQMNILART